MTSKKSIDSFMSKKNIAVIGVSSKGKGFGTAVFSHLKKNGFNVFGVNKNGGIYENEKLYESLNLIPEKIDAVVTVVPPIETEKVVTEANELGIKDIWMQQGSESKAAIDYCNENGMNIIAGECILMFAEPVKSIHSFHRWINRIIGKYPTN